MPQVPIVFAVFIFSVAAFAQQPAAAPLPATGSDVAAVAGLIDQAAESTNLDLARLRIEKWKADGSVKQEAQHNTASLERSLSAALPELTGKARNSPGDVVALFHLYRTVGAVYDVLSNVAETAGAFGQKSEYEQLALDVQRFDQARHDLGDAIEQAATRQSADLSALRTAAAGQHAAELAAPPKKIIVDDTEAAPRKKRAVRKKKAATAPATAEPK